MANRQENHTNRQNPANYTVKVIFQQLEVNQRIMSSLIVGRAKIHHRVYFNPVETHTLFT
jgi:hypothetical protein